MKSATAIRHVHFEDLGIFADVLARCGYDVDYVDPACADLSDQRIRNPDLLIVLGGPIGAYEEAQYPFIERELDVLRHRLAARLPVLGICLGAQLIARALGANVYPGSAKEIGWASLSLSQAGLSGPLASLADTPVLHWHGDTFDLPEDAVLLASTDRCTNQAFAVGDHILGLQFHPETSASGFERWLVGHAFEIASTPGISVESLRAQAARHAVAGAAAGQALLDQWLDGIAR